MSLGMSSVARDVAPGADPAPSLPAPGSVGAWVLAMRPKTLSAAWSPVIVGAACAYAAGGFAAGPALAALVGASLIQIGTNFANDVFDFEKGADDDQRLGPTRAVQAGLLSPRQMRGGMIGAFAAATVVGAYLVAVGGWPIVAIGIASIAAGVAYTGGPYPLGYHGLGDVFVMAFFGFVAVCGTAWVQMTAVPTSAWLASIGVGAVCTAILVVNNTRDASTDTRAGKRTLVVRFGVAFGRAEFVGLLVVAGLVPFVLHATGFGIAVYAPLLALPIGVGLTRAFLKTPPGPGMNPLLGKTAGLLLVYSVLLAAGIAAGATG